MRDCRYHREEGGGKREKDRERRFSCLHACMQLRMLSLQENMAGCHSLHTWENLLYCFFSPPIDMVARLRIPRTHSNQMSPGGLKPVTYLYTCRRTRDPLNKGLREARQCIVLRSHRHDACYPPHPKLFLLTGNCQGTIGSGADGAANRVV